MVHVLSKEVGTKAGMRLCSTLLGCGQLVSEGACWGSGGVACQTPAARQPSAAVPIPRQMHRPPHPKAGADAIYVCAALLCIIIIIYLISKGQDFLLLKMAWYNKPQVNGSMLKTSSNRSLLPSPASCCLLALFPPGAGGPYLRKV